MREKVEEVLGRLRPMLEADGGSVELVDIKDGTVEIRLTGACAGCSEDCPIVPMDMEIAIEELLKKEIPEIKEVINLDEI